MNVLDRTLWADLIGLPYQHRGRGPDAYDCYGLLLTLCERQGTPIAPLTTPDSAIGIGDAVNALLPQWEACPRHAGVALLFLEDGLPQHVGVAIDEDRFIHAAVRNGQVAIDHLSRGWNRLLMGSYRPRST
jgi:hypothetical protein